MTTTMPSCSEQLLRCTAALIACRVMRWPPGPPPLALQREVEAARARLLERRAPGFEQAFAEATRGCKVLRQQRQALSGAWEASASGADAPAGACT